MKKSRNPRASATSSTAEGARVKNGYLGIVMNTNRVLAGLYGGGVRKLFRGEHGFFESVLDDGERFRYWSNRGFFSIQG